MSREHIISRSQFDGDSITLQGLPWCVEPKTVGLASLVAKNLCRDHNTQLSLADHEAKRFKDGLGAIAKSVVVPVRMKLDARLIEQWLLKTTINLALQTPDSGIELSDENVRRAFGLSTPARGQGFFAVAERHENQAYDAALKFETRVRAADGRLVIGAFNFHGWRALYAFEGAPQVNGAMRIRLWQGKPHWLRFRWQPALEPSDRRMPSLHAREADADVED